MSLRYLLKGQISNTSGHLQSYNSYTANNEQPEHTVLIGHTEYCVHCHSTVAWGNATGESIFRPLVRGPGLELRRLNNLHGDDRDVAGASFLRASESEDTIINIPKVESQECFFD